MQKIQIEIKKFLENHTVRELQKQSWVWASVIYSILNNEEKKYFPEKLEKLYKFFSLEKDEYFSLKVLNFKWKQDFLWQIFYKKRKKIKLDRNTVAKKIKWTSRHLQRFETWRLNYAKSNYYLKNLLEFYDFSEEEKKDILDYVKNLNKILKILDREKDVL